jgi:RHS repeat-associated protein
MNLSDPPIDTRVYFAGKHNLDTDQNGLKTVFIQDRLGSVARDSLYPWGEDRGTPGANDTVKFATYTRDSATLLDYADQRYYVSSQGRFLTPDPYRATTNSANNPTSPQSWNHYAYVTGDPVNLHDPSGLYGCTPDDPSCTPGCDPSDPSCTPPGCDPTTSDCGVPPPPGQPSPPTDPSEEDIALVAGGLGPGTAAGCSSSPVATSGCYWQTSLGDANGFLGALGLPGLAGAAGAGTITIGGVSVGWEVVIAALGGPEVILTVATIAAGVALYEYWQKETTTERLVRCNEEFFANLHKCASAYPPGSAALKACYAAAKKTYDLCRGIGIQ